MYNVEAEVLEEKVAEPLVEDLVEVDLPRLLQVLDHHRPRLIFSGIFPNLNSSKFPGIFPGFFSNTCLQVILSYIFYFMESFKTNIFSAHLTLGSFYILCFILLPHTWIRQNNLFAGARRWKTGFVVFSLILKHLP